MGYKREPKQYRLKFLEGDMNGFECLMGGLSVDEFIEITTLAQKLSANSAEREDVIQLFDMMAVHIAEWNLEDDDDKPIPHDSESMRKLDFEFVMGIQMAWMDAMAKVLGPLPDGSNNGGTTQTALTQSLGELSRSLPN